MAEDKNTLEAATPTHVRAMYEKEQELLRKTFCKNEDLLRAMSNIMLGTCTDPAEKGLLKATFADEEVFRMTRKRFLPQLDDGMMLAQAKDSWSGIEVDIAGKLPEQVEQFVGYKELLIKMTEQAVALLRNPDGASVDLTVNSGMLKEDPLGKRILARSQFIKNVNQQISFMWIAGNQKKEETKPDAGGKNANPSGKPLASKK